MRVLPSLRHVSSFVYYSVRIFLRLSSSAFLKYSSSSDSNEMNENSVYDRPFTSLPDNHHYRNHT